MKVAVHERAGSFSDRWIETLRACGVETRVVDATRSDVIDQLRGVDAFLWHFHHSSATDLASARHVLHAASRMGIKVFPDLDTSIHFDDKVAQKYLFEAIDAPHVPAWVFYEQERALEWLRTATFPLVFKLRRGASASNVRLLTHLRQARRIVRRCFGRGFSALPRITAGASGHLRAAGRTGRLPRALLEAPAQLWRRHRRNAALPNERGYVYFQRFVPDNERDIRVTVIGERAFVFHRLVRPGDFRASGSGRIVYPDPGRAEPAPIRIAHRVARDLGSQSAAFDFVYDRAAQEHLILEVSYGYLPEPVMRCGGYYDGDLTWNAGVFRPEDLILQDLLGLRLPAGGRGTPVVGSARGGTA